MRNGWGMLATLAGVLLLAACGTLPQQNLHTGPDTGDLQVQLSGLPEGAQAAVSVIGPDGFGAELTASGMLSELVPGEYSVEAVPVTGFEPAQAEQSVLVVPGELTLVTVAYQVVQEGDPEEQEPPEQEPEPGEPEPGEPEPGEPEPGEPDPQDPLTGNISFMFSGQPEATPVTATLVGPQETLQVHGSTDLQDMPVGDYTVAASVIDGYESTVRPAAFTLNQGTHIVVTIDYHLPGQETPQPQFTVDWPQEPFQVTLGAGFSFDVTFSGDEVLADGYILTRSGPADWNVEFDYLADNKVHVTVSDNGALPGRSEFNLAAYHTTNGQLEVLPILVDVQLQLTTHLDAMEPEPGMLRYLLQDPRTQGDTIAVDPAFVELHPVIDLVDQLYLEHNVTIHGSGLQLDAGGEHRVMQIAPQATVSIHELTLLNGRSDGGGNLKVDGQLTMTQSQVLHGATISSVGDWDLAGGGVFVGRDGSLVLDGSLVRWNHSARGVGGGIMNYGSLTISHSVLRDNVGDGITSAAGTLNLHEASVNFHSGGSAVQITAGEALISHSEFRENHTNGQGGGILNAGSLTVLDSLIVDNKANNRGGGIANRAMGTILVERSIITGNWAHLSGGGIYNVGAFSLADSEVEQNVTGEDPAGIGGAGIMHEPIFADGVMDISRSQIRGNFGMGHGGGVASLGHLNLIDSYLHLNYTLSGSQGAGLYVGYSVSSPEMPLVTVRGSTLHDNSADGRGGGIAISGPMDLSLDMSRVASLQVINSTLFANRADSHGGGLSVNGAVALLELAGVTIAGNTSGAQGGGIHSSTVPVTLTWSLLANNNDATPWPNGQTGYGTIIRSQGNNLYSHEPLWSNLAASDRVMANPPLATALANNGGHTLTLLPGAGVSSGSVCITAGFPSGHEEFDQRGLKRYGTLDCTPGAVVLQEG